MANEKMTREKTPDELAELRRRGSNGGRKKQARARARAGIQWEGREYGVLAAIRVQNERATLEAAALMREALEKGWAWEDDADLRAALFRVCGGVTWEHGDTDTTGKGGL